ncbi:MAG: hypothetical protein IJU58_01895 [Clostridia bacterium]|nr:hypothetical protein [Clostridia bacterium]
MEQSVIENAEALTPAKEKIALLELTPRSAKLILAWYTSGVSFEICDEITEPLRAYEDMYREGYIKPTAIAEAIRIVKMFRKLCDAMKVTKAIAYASSAFRDAKNYFGFLDEIEIASGFKIRLMTPEDEITACYTGVVNTLDVPKGIILNIDEDKTQVIIYSRKNILYVNTIDFGADTLSSLFMQSGTPQEQAQAMCDFFGDELKKLELPEDLDITEMQFVGVGEIFKSLATISRRGKKYPLELSHNYVISSKDTADVYNAVKVLDVDKRAKIKGVSSASAGVLSGGLSIVTALINKFNIEKVVICGSSIATGVMFNQCVPITAEKPIVDILVYSLNANVAYYGEDERNGLHVYTLAMMLFKQLRVQHKLTRQHIKCLKIACYLNSCGKRLRYQNSNKNALPIILNSQIYGASHRDLVLAGFVVSSQNSEDFSLTEWVKYKDIVQEEDLDAVRKLAVLLKICVGLDKTQQSHVKDIVCDVLGDSVIMKTVLQEQNTEAAYEIECAKEARADFKRVFGKNLELI